MHVWYSYSYQVLPTIVSWLYYIHSTESIKIISSPIIYSIIFSPARKTLCYFLSQKLYNLTLTVKYSYCRAGKINIWPAFSSFPHSIQNELQLDLLSSKPSVVILCTWQDLRDTDGIHCTSTRYFTDFITTWYPQEAVLCKTRQENLDLVSEWAFGSPYFE